MFGNLFCMSDIFHRTSKILELEYVAEDLVTHSFIIKNVKRGSVLPNGDLKHKPKIIIFEESTLTCQLTHLRSFGVSHQRCKRIKPFNHC